MSLVDYNSTSDSEDEQDYLQYYESNISPSSREYIRIASYLLTSYYKYFFQGKLQKNFKQVKNSKTHQSVKIYIPSLNEFSSEEEEQETRKKSKQLFDSESLLNVLPLPNRKLLTNTSFIPNILNKKACSETNKTLQQNSGFGRVSKLFENDQELYSDDDSEISETFDDEIWKKVCTGQKRYKTNSVQEYKTCSPVKPTSIVQLAPEVQKPYVGLNNKAFRDMIKQKREHKGNTKVTNVQEDEIQLEREQWLKSLTDPKYEPQTTIPNPVNSTCRIKNHITALAQKALASDHELQLKWSENKHNRRLTQAKYGF